MEKSINFKGKKIYLNSCSIKKLKEILEAINEDEQKIKQELDDILKSLT